jgi:hypothetical protein
MNMKTKAVMAFCLMITGLFEANAQSLRGKVIYISPIEEVRIKFGSVIENYSFVNKLESENFKMKVVNNRSVVISSLNKYFKSTNLVITENKNTHLFILRFKDQLEDPETLYDFSTREKLLSEIQKIASADNLPNWNSYVKLPTTQPANIMDEAPKVELDSAQNELDNRYADFLTRANKSYLDKNYDEAKGLYTAALALKPDDSLCISQLKVIQLTNDLIKLEEQETAVRISDSKPAQSAPEQQQPDTNHADLIARADKAYMQGSYDEAHGLYTAALMLKPGEDWSSSQLNKIQLARDSIKLEEQKAAELLAKKKDIAEAEQVELDKKYADLVTLAGQSYRNKNYDEAAGLYTAALVLKPTDSWCISQLAKIKSSRDSVRLEQQRAADQLQSTMKENAKAGQKTLDAKYTDLVALANKEYTNKNYDESIGLYKAALLLKPGDTWCASQLNAIQTARIGAQQKAAKAESQIQASKNVAATPIPEQPEPKSDTRLAQLISSANKAYVARKYEEATELYSTALKLKPNDTWCISQLNSIQTLKALHEQKGLSTQHATLTARANKAYVARKYDEASKLYLAALKLIPDDAWAISQLKTIQNTTGAINRKNREGVEELQAAMKIYTKQGQKQPGRKFTELVTLANNAYIIRKYEEANDLYSVALRLEPNDEWCMAQLNIIKSVKSHSRPKITRR